MTIYDDFGGFFENEPRRLEGVAGSKGRKKLSGFWGSLIEEDIIQESVIRLPPTPPTLPTPPKVRFSFI